MLHTQLIMTQEEVSFVVEKHLERIIQNVNFERINSEIKQEILNLRDILDRY